MNALSVPLKRIIRSSLLGCTICLLSLPGRAITAQDIPNPRQTYGGWVADSAQILKPETEAQLNRIINDLEASNGAEIAVVTVSDTASAGSPKAFATALFNDWHIGKKGQDNGVLFLISVGDRRVEIETGYGVEAVLPDAKVGRIIQQEVTPRFKQGDFDGGTIAGTRALVVVLQGQEPGSDSTFSSNSSDNRWFKVAIVVIGGALGISGGMGWFLFRRSIALTPDGISRVPSWQQWFENSRVLHCKNCGQRLQPAPLASIESRLTPAQKGAEAIGSAEFMGWCCPQCGANKIHLRVYESLSPKFKRCPDCQELTVLLQDSEIIQQPTLLQPGLLRKTYECRCCGYLDEVEQEHGETYCTPNS
ncbi:TPM domain-containing protein [Leptolyngbya ohadii]|uniref:TPM domain-containing protein n=1 Tax=Leptolyngbya ohadii TaxID=1962290 RepID=UPI000B599A49|nr:TPM domain-containing protein [Leptolyngbya ohadii]